MGPTVQFPSQSDIPTQIIDQNGSFGDAIIPGLVVTAFVRMTRRRIQSLPARQAHENYDECEYRQYNSAQQCAGSVLPLKLALFVGADLIFMVMAIHLMGIYEVSALRSIGTGAFTAVSTKESHDREGLQCES